MSQTDRDDEGMGLRDTESEQCALVPRVPDVVLSGCGLMLRSAPGSPTCTGSCTFLIFREKCLPCERVLSVGERVCKIAPGEERLFHPVSKPSQRDKFCCFCFVCEFFSTQLYSSPETMGPVLASKEWSYSCARYPAQCLHL